MALTKAHNRMIEGAAVNVKDFGAVGDGVTDDTAAIQAALDSGADVIIINTDSKISSLTLPTNVTIIIQGEINVTGTIGLVGTSLYNTNISFEGRGKLTGDGVTNAQSAVEFTSCSACKIDNAKIEAFLNKGISFVGTTNPCNHNTIINPRVRGATGTDGAGISLLGSNCQYNTVSYADCSSNRIGITINGSHNNSVIHPTCNSCSLIGVAVDGIVSGSGDGGTYNKIDHPICNGSLSSSYGGVYLGNGSSYNEVIHPVCNNGVGAGIRLSNGSGFEGESNKIIDPICKSNAVNGVTASWSPRLAIINPTITSNTGRGISDIDCDGIRIFGGFIDSNTTEGIFHQSIRSLDSGVTVTNNNEGIQIAYGGSLGLGSNVTESCHLENNTTAQYVGAGGSTIRDTTGYIVNKVGVDTKSDGQTIGHGLSVTPTKVLVSGSVANEFVSVTAIGATTFTVAVKKYDGTAGTSQSIYWQAYS